MYRLTLLLLTLAGICPNVQALNRFFAEPMLFGVHRGGSQWRPEHTVDTYKEVAQHWPNALLEMDVRLTTDGTVVLHHDAKVDRTTEGTGRVEDLTLAEVQTLDAGYDFTSDNGQTFPYRGKGLRIATLDEVLTALPTARWLIELKTGGPLVTAVAEVIKAHNAQQRVIIASFIPAVVEEAKLLLPDALTCFTMTSGSKMFGALRAGGETWENYQPEDDILSLSKGMIGQFSITPEEFKKIQAKGIKIQLHTLNTEQELRDAIAQGIDSVLTDRPDIFAKVLEDQ